MVHVIWLEFRQQDNDLRLCDRGRPSQGTNIEIFYTLDTFWDKLPGSQPLVASWLDPSMFRALCLAYSPTGRHIVTCWRDLPPCI